MTSEAKIYLRPEMKQDIENKMNNCTACFASGENLKYKLPKKSYREFEKLSEPGQENQLDFIWKLHHKLYILKYKNSLL